MIGAIVRWFVKQASVGREQARLGAQARHAREQEYYRLGREYVESLTVCPECHQAPKDDVIGCHWEYANCTLHYCKHPIHRLEYLNRPAMTEMYNETWAKVYEIGKRRWSLAQEKKI